MLLTSFFYLVLFIEKKQRFDVTVDMVLLLLVASLASEAVIVAVFAYIAYLFKLHNRN